MQIQEVVEKLKDIFISQSKRELKTKDIAKELISILILLNSMKFRKPISINPKLFKSKKYKH